LPVHKNKTLYVASICVRPRSVYAYKRIYFNTHEVR